MTAALISIIGPPASGKTTLAEHLSEELPGKLIREDYRGNPFLRESYVGSPDSRLPGQIHFLMSRVKQLFRDGFPPEGVFISDYGFCQDRIYACLRLCLADFEIYHSVAARVDHAVHAPKLMIRLDASVEVLLRRIAERGRDYEKTMTDGFLTAMRSEYDALLVSASCPVISVDTESVDVRDSNQRGKLISAIREKL